MKKLIAITLMAAMAIMTVGPSLTVATDTTFKYVADGGSGSGNPIIKAKGETPDNADPSHQMSGTQLQAIGQWQEWTNYQICVIATDPDGIADLDDMNGALQGVGVFAEIYYPDEYPGCSVKIEKNKLVEELLENGKAKFANAYGDNIVHFNTGYNYAEAYHELEQGLAKVYCHDKQLWYEDPHGLYGIEVHAVDKGGLTSEYLVNDLEYAKTVAFEVDFDKVDYGDVKFNTEKMIPGDYNWDYPLGTNPASVRNVGNTRLKLKVYQNDMGLGKTGTDWNVGYDARMGPKVDDADSTRVVYDPEVWKGLPNVLELSTVEKLDFSIIVHEANAGQIYIGTMYLDANYQAFEGTCCD